MKKKLQEMTANDFIEKTIANLKVSKSNIETALQQIKTRGRDVIENVFKIDRFLKKAKEEIDKEFKF